jgi:hypothetical protein
MSQIIHMAVPRHVKLGREHEFERQLSIFAQRSLAESGSRGVHFLYPTPSSSSNEYGVIRSFASASDREAFYKSPLYLEWLSTVEELVEGEPEYRELSGMEAWFRNPHSAHPPRWKMALLTLVAVWPVSMGVRALLCPLIGLRMPHVIFAGAVAVGIVLVLTWVAMPLLTKLAQPWLQPKV